VLVIVAVVLVMNSGTAQTPKKYLPGELKGSGKGTVDDLLRFKGGVMRYPIAQGETPILTCFYEYSIDIPINDAVAHFWIGKVPAWLAASPNKRLLDSLVVGPTTQCPNLLPGIEKYTKSGAGQGEHAPNPPSPTSQVQTKPPEPSSQTAVSRSETLNLLYHEPEMVVVQNLRRSLTQPMSPGQRIAAQVQIPRRVNEQYSALEDRLHAEVYKCGFCASKQSELTMLFKTELTERSIANGIGDAISDDQTSPDANRMIKGLFSGQMNAQEAAPFPATFQYPFEPAYAKSFNCDAKFAQSRDLKSDCERKYSDKWQDVLAAHYQVWPDCFATNDWAEDASKRIAYEACLKSDPFEQLCLQYTTIDQCGIRVTSHNVDKLRQLASTNATKKSQSRGVSHRSFYLNLKQGTRVVLTIPKPIIDPGGRNDPNGMIATTTVASVVGINDETGRPYTIPAGTSARLTYAIHHGGDFDATLLELKLSQYTYERFNEVHVAPAIHDQPGVVLQANTQVTVVLDVPRSIRLEVASTNSAN